MMGLRDRIVRLERLLKRLGSTVDLRSQAAFAFLPGDTPPDLAEDHFARPFVDLLILMDRLTVPVASGETIIA